MGAIDDFMKRRGWAKLDRYGLVLTPDDRVLSARPAVLDDGLGGKIVGWVDGDLAAMELDRWAPAGMPAAAKTVAVTSSLQSRQPPPRPQLSATRSLPGVAHAPEMPAPAPSAVAPAPAPIIAATALVIAAPAPAPVVAAPPPAREVAAEPPVEEDEWEWEIVMARARAAADEVGTAAAAMGFTKPKAPAPRTMQMPAIASPAAPTLAAPRTMQMAAVAAGKPEPMPQWPKTERLAPQWSDETAATQARVMSPLEKQVAVEKRTTVIPVPTLPVALRPSDVRPAASPRTTSPRMRIARGTGRETAQTQTVAPPKDDRTSPYITLPSEVRTSGYAHTKRVAAKQR